MPAVEVDANLLLGSVKLVGGLVGRDLADDFPEELHRLQAAFSGIAGDLQVHVPVRGDDDFEFTVGHGWLGGGLRSKDAGRSGGYDRGAMTLDLPLLTCDRVSVFPMTDLQADGAVGELLLLHHDELAGLHLVFQALVDVALDNRAGELLAGSAQLRVGAARAGDAE